MKNRIISLLTIVILMLFSVTLSSCEKYDYPIDRNLSEIFESTSGKFSTYYSKKTKLTIKTGKYNYAVHFRLTYDGEEILNSKDYNYLVPKGLTIFSKIIEPCSDKKISFELLNNNLKIDVNNSELEERPHIALNISQSEKVNYTDEYLSTKYKINSYEQTISKGYTYVLFDNNNIDDRDSIKYIQSQSQSFIFNDANSYLTDSQGNGYGYFEIYGKRQFTLDSDDIIIHNAKKCYNVYLSEIKDSKVEFDVVVYGYLKVNIINIDTKKQWYTIKYSCESLDKEHIVNSKVIPDGDVVTIQPYDIYKPMFSVHSKDNTMYFWYDDVQYSFNYDLDTMYSMEFYSDNYYCERTYHFEIR